MLGSIHRRGSDAKLLTSSQGRFVSRALFPFDVERSVEFNELRIAPLHREMAEAHPAGTRENLIVAKGVVKITVGSHKPLTLAEGDAVLFDADSPHCYQNIVTNEAVLYLVMSHGGRGVRSKSEKKLRISCSRDKMHRGQSQRWNMRSVRFPPTRRPQCTKDFSLKVRCSTAVKVAESHAKVSGDDP